LAGRVTRFDIDRGYYATVLIAIASYYVLFAIMAGEGLVPEAVAAAIFAVAALLGAYRWAPLIGAGILLHGVFDFAHPMLIENSGVPAWWPVFCGGVDIVLGAWVIYLAASKRALLQRGDVSPS
jgi:hypothetical protein